MAEPVSPLVTFSDHVAVLVERASASIVAVHGGGRWSSSGIHWRPGVIVTAEEVLERDEELAVMLPGGRKVAASLGVVIRAPTWRHCASRHRACRSQLPRMLDRCGPAT
jgi:hypothetical protein